MEQNEGENKNKERRALNCKAPIIIITCIIVFMLAMLAIVNLIGNNNKNRVGEIDLELARAMTYEQYKEGEEAVENTNGGIKFSAFFLRDLDGDNIADKVKGTCKETGTEDQLYLEIKVLEEGKLQNAKIKINADNFYFDTAILKDDEVKNNYISNNTKEIELKDLENGTQKLLLGNVRSGDYSQINRRLDALGKNTNKYTGVSTVTLEGTYVPDKGEPVEISKEYELKVDWYGKTQCLIPEYYKNWVNNKNILITDNFIGTEAEQVTFNYTVVTRETANELLLSKSHIEGTFPKINGFLPTDVIITGKDVEYTYNKGTGEYTAERNATLDDTGKVAENAYSMIYDTLTFNEYSFIVTYPQEVFEEEGFIDLVMPIKAYYEGYNNKNEGIENDEEKFNNPYQSEIVEDNIRVRVEKVTEVDIEFRTIVGKLVTLPHKRYVVPKSNVLKIYNKDNEYEEHEYYKEKWSVRVGQNTDVSGITMKDGQNLLEREDDANKTNEFVKSDMSTEEIGDMVKYVGIYFDGCSTFLNEDGWIRVYNDDTEEVIAEFTKDNWYLYSENNPYYYPEGIKHIRIETSEKNKECAKLSNSLSLIVNNIKELDNEAIAKKYSREQFDNIKEIQSTLVGYANYGTVEESDIRYVETNTHKANYEEELSLAQISMKPTALSTQTTNEVQIVLSTIKDEENNEIGWVNGTFLLKFPKQIIDLQVKDIIKDNNSINVENYEVYEKDGNYYIKIYTKNSTNTSEGFKLTLKCDVTSDPTISTATTQIELYASNEFESIYFYPTADEYDVNDNGNTSELVGDATCKMELVSPTSLITSTTASEYDENGSTAISPKIAKMDKNQKSAKVSINITNNYINTVSDIVLIGKIPFLGNEYILNKKQLGSEFTTTMQNTGIEIPSELQNYATIYYSEEENPTTDIKLETNKWQTKDDLGEDTQKWDKVKSYMIVLENFEMPKDKNYIFTYKIDMPSGIEYNKIAYATHAVYFSLNTEEGKYETNVESNKLGIMIAKQYDLELTKYQVETDKTVANATYSVTDVKTGESRTAVTNAQGKLTIPGLYVEKEYKIKEIKASQDYAVSEEEILINTNINNEGNLEVTVHEKEKLKSLKECSATKENDIEYWKVNISVQDEPKARLEIVKTDKETGASIEAARFKITGEGKSGLTVVTNSEGKIESNGYYLGQEYSIEETKANGYFLLSEQIKFIITREGKEYKFEIIQGEDQVIEKQLTMQDGIPVLSVKIQNTPRPTYKLEILKVPAGTVDNLPNAKFKIEGPGIDRAQNYKTNEQGSITINGLYLGTEENDTQEYTLTETEAPQGYLKREPIGFKVYKGDEQEQPEVVITKGQVKTTEVYKGESEEVYTITLIVEDDPVFKLIKKDGKEEDKLLPNVKFALYSIGTDGRETFATNVNGELLGEKETINGQEYRVLTTDKNGQITADLGDGRYKVVELQTAEGYEFPEDEEERTFYFGIGDSLPGKVEVMDKWSKVIKGDSTDGSSAVSIQNMIKTTDGGYLVNGYFNSKTLTLTKSDGQTIKLTNNGASNSFIIKYNSKKEIEWANSIGGSGYDNGYNKIVETTDGGYILAGNSSYNSGDVKLSDGTTETILASYGGGDIVIVKYNFDGTIQWSDIVGGSNKDNICAITLTEDKGIIISVSFISTSIQSNKNQNNIQELKAGSYLIKYNKDGQIEWYRNEDAITFGIVETKDDGYLVMKKFYGRIQLTEDKTITSNGNNDIVVIKYDYKWNIIWYNHIGGNGNEEEQLYNIKNNHIIETSDGGYIVVGGFASDSITLSNGDKLYSGGDRYQTFLIKYNKDGKIEWSNQIQRESLADIKETTDGGFILADYNNGLIKLDKNGQEEWNVSEETLGFYPCTVVEEKNGDYTIGGYCSSGNLTLPSEEKIEVSAQSGLIVEYEVTVTPEMPNLNDVNTIPGKTEYIPEWAYYEGGTVWDGQVNQISELEDGGYIVAHAVMSTNIKITEGLVLNNHGTRWDATLIRYDENGNPIWGTIVGGTGDEGFYDVLATKDGGFIAVGYYKSADMKLQKLNSNEETITNTGANDGFVIKYNSEGDIEWYDTIGGSSDQNVGGVIQTDDEGYIVVCQTKGNAKLSNKPDITISDQNNNAVILIKYDKNGNILWNKVAYNIYTNNIIDLNYKLIDKTEDNGFILAYYYSGTAEGRIEKFNSEGENQWVKTISGATPTAVSQTTDGGYVAVANYNNNIQLSNGDIIVNETKTNNSILIKYDSEGNIEWHRESDGEKENDLYCVEGLSNGDIAVTGCFDTKVTLSDGTTMDSYWQTQDGMLLIYDHNGNIKWNYTAFQSSTDTIACVMENSKGEILIGGVANGLITDNSEKNIIHSDIVKNKRLGSQDGYIVKFKEHEISPEKQGKLELIIENNKKEYKIQTAVRAVAGVKGGTISGEEVTVYETVEHGKSSTSEIVMEPNENYEIADVTVNGKHCDFKVKEGETKKYTIDQFDNVTEDKYVVVTYVLSSSKVTIEKVDATDESKKLEGARLRLERIPTEQEKQEKQEDAEYTVEVVTNSEGKAVTQLPYGTYKVTELEAPEGYEINNNITNIEFSESGDKTFKIQDSKKPSVTVHHYLRGRDGVDTDQEVAPTEVYFGEEGDTYRTQPKTNLEKYVIARNKENPEEYDLPEDMIGTYQSGEKVIDYYYEERTIPLTVHYYIKGTEQKVPLAESGGVAEDVEKSGYKGDHYETTEALGVSEKYELDETPYNAQGEYGDEEIVVIYYYNLKTVNITTKVVEHDETDELGQTVKVAGGTITGDQVVEYGENPSEDIVIQPLEGYKVKTIKVNEEVQEFQENADRTVQLDSLEHLTQDTLIEVEFEKLIGKVTVHHYIAGTENTKVPGKEPESVIEDEIKTGYVGSMYATKPSEDISEVYMYSSSKGDRSGTYTEEDKEVTYYYITRQAQVIVHHYIYDAEAETEENKKTKKSLVVDEVKEGIVGQEYTTQASSEVPANYVCVDAEPENHAGNMVEGTIEVSYYYQLTEPNIENEIEITATANEQDEEGTAVLTKERGVVTYNIKYTVDIRDYIGKAKIEIEDTLPAGINTDKSELSKGVYDADAHTIKWVEEIEGIDTFANKKTSKRNIQRRNIYSRNNKTNTSSI